MRNVLPTNCMRTRLLSSELTVSMIPVVPNACSCSLTNASAMGHQHLPSAGRTSDSVIRFHHSYIPTTTRFRHPATTSSANNTPIRSLVVICPYRSSHSYEMPWFRASPNTRCQIEPMRCNLHNLHCTLTVSDKFRRDDISRIRIADT